MNILPKKRWHVRTKDNIARVRRDEAEARKQEDKRLEKLKFAESEARINFLRRHSCLPERQCVPAVELTSIPPSSAAHIDLFADFKSHVKTSNKELEKEQKEEREKYEKQIGYLTYLGQDTNEALKVQSWYEVAPTRLKSSTITTDTTEKDSKTKISQDPLTFINALLPNENKSKVTSNFKAPKTIRLSCDHSESRSDRQQLLTNIAEQHKQKKRKKEKKSKHRKNGKSHKKDKRHDRKKELEVKQQQKRDIIDQLRKERLRREKAERTRQDELLKPKDTITDESEKKQNSKFRVVQKYNSQFNPELAKQNIN